MVKALTVRLNPLVSSLFFLLRKLLHAFVDIPHGQPHLGTTLSSLDSCCTTDRSASTENKDVCHFTQQFRECIESEKIYLDRWMNRLYCSMLVEFKKTRPATSAPFYNLVISHALHARIFSLSLPRGYTRRYPTPARSPSSRAPASARSTVERPDGDRKRFFRNETWAQHFSASVADAACSVAHDTVL